MKTIDKKLFHKWKYTVILLVVLAAVFACGITALYFFKQDRQMELYQPYNVTEELYGFGSAALKMEKSDGFAANLCVSDHNIALDGVSISGNTMAGLFDLEHASVLYAQNIHQKAYPASITKIMTAIVAVKYGNLDDTVTITSDVLGLETGSTEIGFMEGDQVTLRELLHGLLIYSGNDAAMAIAKHVGGSVDDFVEMMNEEAHESGATNTHFVNPSGLHDENHYTTVYDIYLMMQEISKYPELLSIMQQGVYTMSYTRGEETLTKRLDSTDQYLTRQITPPKNVAILGGKTGTTSDAGSCLTLLTQNAYGQLYISVVLHAPTKVYLYDYMNQLLGKTNE